MDSSTSTTAIANPTFTATRPSTGAVNTEEFPLARVFFAGTAAADNDCAYQIVIWRGSDNQGEAGGPLWIPTIMAQGIYTLGLTTSAIPGANGFFADTITDTVKTGGIVHSPADDSIAWLDVPVENAQYIQVTVDRDGGISTSTTADVLVQLGEDIGGAASLGSDTDLGDVDLVAGGNAMTRFGANGDTALATGSQAAQLRIISDDLGTIDGDTGTIKTNTDTLVIVGGGGYIRQDSNDTIAKETGGNLAAAASDLNELTAAPVAKVPLAVVMPLPGSPEPTEIVASETFATAVYLTAARAGGDNTGDIFIGLADVVSGSKNYHKLSPGATFEYVCRAGTKVDLQSFLIDGETGTDGVIGHYEPV